MDVQEQRVRFVVLASRGEKPFSALCREFGIARPTGYEWVSRYAAEGLAGVVERSRRPHCSPRQTARDTELAVVGLRQRYPDWGARKLQRILANGGLNLTVTTIHRIVQRHGLIVAPRISVPAVQRFERSQPNELWQMDFKGPLRAGQSQGPLSVLDDHSRYLIALEPLESGRTEAVKSSLERAFEECGVPEAMLMDHGTPWWGVQSPGGLTSLSLWLMKQGIGLHWGRIRHPQTQGKVERFHGELQRAFERRQPGLETIGEWLRAYRWEHNHLRPHEALGMATPATRWQASPRRFNACPQPWEYPAGAHVLKVDSQGKITVGDRNWQISAALSGERVQLVRIDERVLVFYCRTLLRELDLASQRSTIVDRWLTDSNSS